MTNYPTECPNKAYVCEVTLPDGVNTMSCEQDDGNGTVSTFDPVTGISTFSSNNMYNTIYEPGKSYSIVITVHAGDVAANIVATSSLILDLPCMVDKASFVWTIPLLEEMEFVVRDYLPAPVYASLDIAPFDLPPFYDDSACNLIGPIFYMKGAYYDDALGNLSLSTGPSYNGVTSIAEDVWWSLSYPLPIGSKEHYFGVIGFTNF